MKFTNNSKNDTIESIINGYKHRVENNFFSFQENYVIGTYYNISDQYSTTTSDTEQVQSYTSSISPLKYNKIENMPLCGLNTIDINMERGDFGLEGDRIEGELYIFPNTIIPVPEDRFKFNHIPNLLFKVLSSTTVKLDNGMNMWRIEYKLNNSNIEDTNIEDNVVEKYIALLNNIGTDLKVVIRESNYNIVKKLEDIISNIKIGYISAFYYDSVDTIILNDNDKLIYDSYLLEFIIQNKLIDDPNIDLILYHHITKPRDFILKYNKSIFKSINDRISSFIISSGYLEEIDDIMSIFMNDTDTYYNLNYNTSFNNFKIFDDSIELDLRNNKSDDYIINIILDIMVNKKYISNDIIESLNYIDIVNNKYNFYIIPLLIYSLNINLLRILSEDNK